jgi:predicted Zn-dependent protease
MNDSTVDITDPFASATAALETGDTATALAELARIPRGQRPPLASSTFAWRLAQKAGEYKIAAALCQEAIKEDPKTADHYLYLGQILLLAGKKKDAIWTLRLGLRRGRHPRIRELLDQLGDRKPPILPFLQRRNPLNRYLGLLLSRLGLR